jgi:hypothetical protein
MKNKNRVTILVLLVLALITGAVFLWPRSPKGKSGAGAVSTVKPAAASGRRIPGDVGATNARAVAKGTAAAKRDDAKRPPRGAKAEDDDVDAAAQAEAERVIGPFQERLDSDDLKVVAAAGRQIMGHANKFVRIKAVEALAWADEAGYKDLTGMIRDKDPEVAREALDAWALKTQTMENSKNKEAAVMEVGEAALNMEADAFGMVLDAMIDMDDAWVLPVLQSYANQTDNQGKLDLIYDAVNSRAMPDDVVESKAQIQPAIDQFMLKRAEEAAAEKQ